MQYGRLGLKDEWDAKGVLLFVEGFESAYNKGHVILRAVKDGDYKVYALTTGFWWQYAAFSSPLHARSFQMNCIYQSLHVCNITRVVYWFL